MDHLLAKQIEDLEVLLLQPEIRRSEEKLSNLLAYDFIEFGMFGKVYDQKSMIKTLVNSGDEEEFEKFNVSEFKAKEILPDTVLLTYKATIEFLKTNEIIDTLRCSIWQKRDDNWQMIFHQGTVIKNHLGQDK